MNIAENLAVIDEYLNRMHAMPEKRIDINQIKWTDTEPLCTLTKNLSPFSEEYVVQMKQIHKHIIGKEYQYSFEGLHDEDDSDSDMWRRKPWNLGYNLTAYYLRVFSYILEIMRLPGDSEILEVGCGEGGLLRF